MSINKNENMVARSQFLTGMGLAMEKHGITWDDVDIDMEKGMIDIKSDLTPREITAFLMDVREHGGDFD